MRCHHIYVDWGGKVFIPGCDSAAVHGAHACVCYPKLHRSHPDKSEIEELRKENKELHRIVKNLTKRSIFEL